MTEQTKTIEEMNAEMLALLEIPQSKIEDLPEFVTPPIGDYLFAVDKFELDAGDDGKQFINVMLSLQSVVGTANPEDLPIAEAIPVGSRVSCRYYGAFGIQKMKSEWKMAMEALVGEDGTIAQFMDAIVGCEVGASTSLRTVKDDDDPSKTRVYFGLRKVIMAV